MSRKASQNNNPGCLGSLFGKRAVQRPEYSITRDEPEKDPFPYRTRDDFMSPAELSFYGVLKSIMGEHMVICPKVSLADIFFVARPNENQGAYSRINRKHVDFLICNPNTLKPVFALELDDASHQRADRQERDEFVDEVFRVAGLPLIHIPARRTYNTAELTVVLKQVFQKTAATTQPFQTDSKAPVNTPLPQTYQSTTTSAPQAGILHQIQNAANTAAEPAAPKVCPRCGASLVLREVSKGPNLGRKFYGCSSFPKCRYVMPA